MNRRLSIGIIVLFALLVIAAAIFKPVFILFVLGGFLIGGWIYSLYVVRKKKTNIFDYQMEPEMAERRLKMLKVFLLVAGISLAVGIVGVILHNVLYGLLGKEEAVSFFIALVGLFMFLIASFGSLVIFRKGRRKQAKEIP